MLINRNQQLEEQLLLGKLQLPQSQFARQAGAAADGVWKRKMNLPAAGVTRPRCVLPSSALSAPEVTVPSAAQPNHSPNTSCPTTGTPLCGSGSPVTSAAPFGGAALSRGAKHRELLAPLPPALAPSLHSQAILSMLRVLWKLLPVLVRSTVLL